METARKRPTHSLEEAKRLAREGRMTINSRAQRFIANHMDVRNPFDEVASLICSIRQSDFCESQPLRVIPGQWGDVYRFIPYAGEEWYVKFFISPDGGLMLNVMSANWEGYIH